MEWQQDYQGVHIMKKTINNIIYDTSKAQFVGCWESEQRGLEHIRETLYYNLTGDFFLFGEGGAKTKYSEKVATNIWSDGKMIIPLTFDEAKEYAKNYLSERAYLSWFDENYLPF